jgi:hypothetical protein
MAYGWGSGICLNHDFHDLLMALIISFGNHENQCSDEKIASCLATTIVAKFKRPAILNPYEFAYAAANSLAKSFNLIWLKVGLCLL